MMRVRDFVAWCGFASAVVALLSTMIVMGGAPDAAAQAPEWSQVGADIDGEAAFDYSGWSVSFSADGTTVAIGAPLNDGSGDRAGHVRVFTFTGGVWVQVGADIDGEAAYDDSARSVSLSADGSMVAAGGGGRVRVFSLDSSGAWVQVGADIDGKAAGDRSVSLSADGSMVAAGGPGRVRVFSLDSSGAWVQVGADIDGEAAGDGFGDAVSLSADGTMVAVGARFDDGSGSKAGHVRVFSVDSSGVWVQVGADIDGEAANDGSGFSVSLSADGSTVAIGAPFNDGSGNRAGHVRVFRLSGGVWVQVGADIDGEAKFDDSGWSVSLSADGSTVAIGAPFNDGSGDYAGHVRVFTLSGGAWVQVGADIDGEAAYDDSGWSVSLSADGSTVAIGARLSSSGDAAGHVRVFSLSCEPGSCGGLPSCMGVTATIVAAAGVTTQGTDGPDVIVGTAGDDLIYANGGDDLICAGTGTDRVFGGQGKDTIMGDDGDDTIHGNRGDDVLDGGAGDDRIFGYSQNDTITGGDGNDRLHGNFGDDTITGGPGDDAIFGYGDNDTLSGGDGLDLIGGNFGDDIINGGPGDDTLYGSDGTDTVNGGHGNDIVAGNSGDDIVNGNAGDDTLDGGINNDSCNGGAGTDTATRCETLTNIE